MTKAGVIVFAVIVCASVTAAAPASSEQERFDAATAEMAAGNDREAAQHLEDLAAAAPTADLADDALFLAAQLFEEKLGEPKRAQMLYRQLLKVAPDSRFARAAKLRAEQLESAMGGDDEGAEAFARFRQLVDASAKAGDAATIENMRQLIAEHPGWSGRGRVLSWIGGAKMRQGDFAAAAQSFESARGLAAKVGDRAAAFDAGLAEAQALLSYGDYAKASARLSELATDTPSQRIALADAKARVVQAQGRSRLAWFSLVGYALIVVALLLAIRSARGSWRKALEALRRPPTELWLMLPFAVLFVSFAVTGNGAVAAAVVTSLLAGLIITWLSGVSLRSRPSGPLVALAHAAGAALALACALFFALERNHLIDLVLATLRMGPGAKIRSPLPGANDKRRKPKLTPSVRFEFERPKKPLPFR